MAKLAEEKEKEKTENIIRSIPTNFRIVNGEKITWVELEILFKAKTISSTKSA